jgi:glucose-6-phosphate 1-dehydrogenase
VTDSTSIVILGASGDLTRRKLIPALFSLCCRHRMPDPYTIVGMARTSSDAPSFRQTLKESMIAMAPRYFDPKEWPAFAERLDYVTGDPAETESLAELNATLERFEAGVDGTRNRLYYMALPPASYAPVVQALGRVGMVDTARGWRRVVIEKPFGHDLPSARALNDLIHQVLHEDQIYRIDHYLGKETVQNVLVFRFANSIFEPVWNRNYVDHVQITVAESVGVGHRGKFFDQVGVLRDMFQNHLMQLLSLVAMEPPASFHADALRNERAKVLNSVRPILPGDVASETVRGQYDGYCQEPGVASDSQTATYAALRLYISNWRWEGVPFFLRSGKALADKSTEITVQFKAVPHMMFTQSSGNQIMPNRLSLCLQPDEGIHLRFEMKVPGTQSETRSTNMEFHYASVFGPDAIPDAYERLLLDALNGDASLFTRADTIELAWGLIDPILEGWSLPGAPPLAVYSPGSWGPEAADTFMLDTGHAWDLGCAEHDHE